MISGGRLLAIGPMSAIGGDEARVPIVQWREDGVLHRLRTTEPARTVAELHSRIGEPTALEVVRPSLEDIYLGLVHAADAAATSATPSAAPSPATKVTTTGVGA